MSDYLCNTAEMELRVATHIGWRKHFIIPNLSFGLGFRHELDLAVVTKQNRLWEIEIKISRADLRADLKKWHGHLDNRITRFYFAIPEKLINCVDLIPDRAGVFVVREKFVDEIKPAKINSDARKLTDQELSKLYRLAAMRVWSMKRKFMRGGKAA